MGILDAVYRWVERVAPAIIDEILHPAEASGSEGEGDVATAGGCPGDSYQRGWRPVWERLGAPNDSCEGPATDSGDDTEKAGSDPERPRLDPLKVLTQVVVNPAYFFFDADPVDPLGDLDSYLEQSGVYSGLNAFWNDLEKSGAARRERLKAMETGGKVLTAGDVAAKIEENLKGQMKNVRVQLKDGRIVINADVPTKLVDLGFVAVIDVSIRDGKVDASVRKAEVAGMDESDRFRDKLFIALQNRGQKIPEGAGLKDLSWLDSMGIKNLVVQDGRILVEMFEHEGPA